MTPHLKTLELVGWDAAKRAREEARPVGFVGGHGYPDPEIYDFVDSLNAIHRLCTLQSCAGHRCGDPPDCCSLCVQEGMVAPEQSEHVWNGQLWLWPDEKLGRWFLQNAPRLAALPNIEKVSVLWHVDGREIIDIQFKGMGHAKHEGQPHATARAVFGTSMTLICAFFEHGNIECNRT